MKIILASVDFSNATPGVTSIAVDLAKAFGAELHLLHVIEAKPTYTAYGFTPEEYPAIHAYHEETRVRALKTLNTLAGTLSDQSGIAIETHLCDGSPLHELEKKVKHLGADLLVLGSHGHGVVASLLLGSVADGMVRKSIVPTLVVPAGKV